MSLRRSVPPVHTYCLEFVETDVSYLISNSKFYKKSSFITFNGTLVSKAKQTNILSYLFFYLEHLLRSRLNEN